MDLQETIEQYHSALDEFARGDPEPVKRIFTRCDDVTLANPFGPAVRGWEKVAAALDFACAHFREGKVTACEPIARYETAELATLLELERWQARVGGRPELSTFELRVTSTLRREDGAWQLVHRHADPIASFSDDGPLRLPPTAR